MSIQNEDHAIKNMISLRVFGMLHAVHYQLRAHINLVENDRAHTHTHTDKFEGCAVVLFVANLFSHIQFQSRNDAYACMQQYNGWMSVVYRRSRCRIHFPLN